MNEKTNEEDKEEMIKYVEERNKINKYEENVMGEYKKCEWE